MKLDYVLAAFALFLSYFIIAFTVYFTGSWWPIMGLLIAPRVKIYNDGVSGRRRKETESKPFGVWDYSQKDYRK